MDFSPTQREGLGVALNEATLLGLEVDPLHRMAGATFSVLTLTEMDGAEAPRDPRVQFVLWPIGRVAASLRHGRWDDRAARVESFSIERLLEVVQSFGGLPIYGGEFVDLPETKFAEWSDRLSLDLRLGDSQDGLSHTLDVFQEGGGRTLDLRLWFDELLIRDAGGNPVRLDSFIAGGKRWWDALEHGDPRTKQAGIYPLKGNPADSLEQMEQVIREANAGP